MDRTPTPSNPARVLAQRVLVVMFCVVVTTPLLVTLCNIARGPGSPREEQLAATPSAPRDASSFMRWPGQFKWYFEQRFGLRECLVRAHGLFKVDGLGVSSNDDVLLGEDDWLFLRSEGVLDYHRHARPFSEEDLEDWVETITERRRWLRERGIAYLLVVAPDKHSVYPEHLPSDVATGSGTTRLDQLVTALHREGDVDVLDLRAVLRAAKNEGRLYHRTDTHWNLLGSWHAARAVVDALADLGVRDALGDDPGASRIETTRGGDLARLLGLDAFIHEEQVVPDTTPDSLRGADGERVGWTPLDVLSRPEVIIESGAGAPRAVLFRDSFGEALLPWLGRCFGRSVWRWSYGFDRDLVESERPDVVIQQLVERKLMTVRPQGEETR